MTRRLPDLVPPEPGGTPGCLHFRCWYLTSTWYLRALLALAPAATPHAGHSNSWPAVNVWEPDCSHWENFAATSYEAVASSVNFTPPPPSATGYVSPMSAHTSLVPSNSWL
ncbi:hypothetical protein SCALM49S_08812 [Streptomyces californicus]